MVDDVVGTNSSSSSSSSSVAVAGRLFIKADRHQKHHHRRKPTVFLPRPTPAVDTARQRRHNHRKLHNSYLALVDIKHMWKPPWPPLLSSLLLSLSSSPRRHLLVNSCFFIVFFVVLLSSPNLSSASSIIDTSTTSTTATMSSVNTPSPPSDYQFSSSAPGSATTTTSSHLHQTFNDVDGDDLLLEADQTAESESRLHRSLMENYSKDARPARVSNVAMHLQLISLDDVQESGVIVLTVQIWMTWRDLRFRWSPSNYSGVVSLQILPVDRIWFPLFWIRNSAQPDIQNSFWSHFPAFIGWTGIVSWVSSGKITVACDLDFFYYPSDSQTCSIQFSAHDTYHVNLTSHDELRPVCFDRYTNNSLWEITGVRAVPTGVTIQRTNEYLSFELRLRRRPLTDILRMFLPTVCLAIVSLIAFLLPPDSGDKLNVTFTTMLAFFVMFLAITDMVPFTAEHTPIMTYFVVTTLLLSTVETIICAVIMTLADAEKAKETGIVCTDSQPSSRKSSLGPLLQHSSIAAVSGTERRGSLGYTWSENLAQLGGCHPADNNEAAIFAQMDAMRPRSYSTSTTTSSNTTDTGIIDLSGTDATVIAALRSKRRKSSTTVLVGNGTKGIDGATFMPRSLRRRVAIFFIRTWRQLTTLLFRNKTSNDDDEDEDTGSYDELPKNMVTAKRLNIISFYLFGAVKIVIISLVSVILYDQSREEEVEAAGFHRPEYTNCWQ